MKSPANEVIAAIATARGAGGIGIVRISGPAALDIASRVYRGREGRSPLVLAPWRLALGLAVDPDSGDRIDEVLAVYMPAGRSYTGEPTVELHGHGGRAVLEAVLQAVLRAGARLAAPGEFTRRAFLSGRLDLSQAEAVAELVRAESEEERRLALLQMQGALSGKLGAVRERLLDLVASCEAVLDFGDEDGAGDGPTAAAVTALAADIRLLIREGRAPAAPDQEARIVIAGRPNCGKSSLFNMLLNFERAIVSPEPGTTRDYLEERSVIGGATITLVDTAGLRASADPVEAEGVRRSRRQIREADLVLVLLDGSLEFDEEGLLLLDELRSRSPIVAIGKQDLSFRISPEALERIGNLDFHRISALTGSGCTSLIEKLVGRCRGCRERAEGEPAPMNERHRDALGRAADALDAARALLSPERGALDQATEEVRAALEALGEVTGETATEAVVERIFSTFCVGK